MLSAVVILYYPDRTINRNLNSIIANVNRLYLVDNTEESQIGMLDLSIVQNSKVIYLHTGSNEGIAIPLNKVCGLAISEGYHLLLTMDQDSFFENSILEKYIIYTENFPEISKVGMFGVSHAENIDLQNLKLNSDNEDVKQLITSGSIVNLDNFASIGNFDENLFIDQVDSEYCFRILNFGFKIIKFKNIFLEHKLGTTKQHTSLKSFKKTVRSLHSSLRIYYMVRNFFYVSSQYRHLFPKEIKDLRKDILNRIKNRFLYGNDRLELTSLILRSYFDFKRNRMGKISNEKD